MRIARVVGNVVSTIKDESYYGYKLMIIEYLDENGQPDGNRLIAFDAGQAGVGDTVLAVSYTHLDVYKRQPINQISLRG